MFDTGIVNNNIIFTSSPSVDLEARLQGNPNSPFEIQTNAYGGVNSCDYDVNDCVTTGSGNYADFEDCVINATTAVTLRVERFDVEGTADGCAGCICDYVQLGGTKYCSISGSSEALPSGASMAPGSGVITWSTDSSGAESGWTICGDASGGFLHSN